MRNELTLKLNVLKLIKFRKFSIHKCYKKSKKPYLEDGEMIYPNN